MSKAQCQLRHNRNLSEGRKYANYNYDRERSKATSKQIKFYQSLWYIFKDNGLSINDELDKRGIDHATVQHPYGRNGYSLAIDTMIDILTEHGLYHSKNDRRDQFIRTYNGQYDSAGGIVRSWEKIEYVGDKECQESQSQ